MAMIRSREISCIVVIQDEAQLEKEYGKAAQGIIANCDSYVFLGSSNIDSCNAAARRLGEPNISGRDIRKMNYNECVVISGNEGGVYKKFDIRTHPRYPLIADSPSAGYYPLSKKHYLKSKERARRTQRPSEAVCIKPCMFDSREEEYLYAILCRISNLIIYPHQHLRDIFQSGDSSYSKKLSLMHCDFIIRNNDYRPLAGIEIDGAQHYSDPEQMVNDRIKDHFFAMNSLPLLRFLASDIRYKIDDVIQRILETVVRMDQKHYEISGSIISFQEWCKENSERQKPSHNT